MIILKLDLLHLFIYISVGSWISFFLFYSVGYNSLSLFASLNYPKFGSWEAFQAGFCILLYECLHHFLSPSLLSSTKGCSRLILFLNPSPGNNRFPKDSWLLLVEMLFRNQCLCTSCAHCYEVFLSQALSVDRVKKHIPLYLLLSLY